MAHLVRRHVVDFKPSTIQKVAVNRRRGTLTLDPDLFFFVCKLKTNKRKLLGRISIDCKPDKGIEAGNTK